MVYWNDDQLACWLDCIPEGEKALVFMKSTDAVKKWRNKFGERKWKMLTLPEKGGIVILLNPGSETGVGNQL